MFNFTTQTIYNSIKSATVAAKGDRVDQDANLIVSTVGKLPSLRIGNTRFTADDILDIQVKNPTVENLASVEFDMSKVLIPNGSTDKERTARVVLYVGLSMNSQDSFYANDFVYKGKPLYVEFKVLAGDTADVVAKRVKTNADKYLLFVMGPERILNVTATTTTSGETPTGTVKFTGINGYLQIKKASLLVFDPEAKVIDCCSNLGEYVDVVVGVPVVYTTNASGVATVSNKKIDETGAQVNLEANEVAIAPGLEAFGDYNWIIHNLRLPTAANYYIWSPTNRAGEMPVPGQQYTQFIVRILKERDGIMGEIVGARGTSVTTHVLYVAGIKTQAGSAAKTVNDAFTTLLGASASTKMKTTADTDLQLPYA